MLSFFKSFLESKASLINSIRQMREMRIKQTLENMTFASPSITRMREESTAKLFEMFFELFQMTAVNPEKIQKIAQKNSTQFKSHLQNEIESAKNMENLTKQDVINKPVEISDSLAKEFLSFGVERLLHDMEKKKPFSSPELRQSAKNIFSNAIMEDFENSPNGFPQLDTLKKAEAQYNELLSRGKFESQSVVDSAIADSKIVAPQLEDLIPSKVLQEEYTDRRS